MTLAIVASFGYESVALTLDHDALKPLAAGWRQESKRIANLLSRLHLRSVVETGARFLLDPWRKQIDAVNAAGKKVDGKWVYPTMYGEKGWYAFVPHRYAKNAKERREKRE